MEFKEAFFGHHTIAVWLGTILWTLTILIVFKLGKSPKLSNGFKFKHFVNDNLFDAVLNVALACIMLRAGDGFIHFIYKIVNQKLLKPMFDFELKADGMDVIIMVSIIVLPLSYIIHKFWRKPINKQMAVEMHEHNENCKH